MMLHRHFEALKAETAVPADEITKEAVGETDAKAEETMQEKPEEPVRRGRKRKTDS